MDNRGNHLIAVDDSAINTPAIAAGHVTKRYTAQARDEITFEVISVVYFRAVNKCQPSVWSVTYSGEGFHF